MAGNLGVLGFLSMVGLAITLSKEALIGVALAAQLTLFCSFLETPTLHAQTAIFLGSCLNANSSALALPQVCELDDSKKFFENVSERGQGGNRDYHVVVSDSKNLEYIMSVLKQLL